MVGWILRLILIIIIVRAIWRLVAGVLDGMEPRVRTGPTKQMPLVRDPVCGTFVVPSKALVVGAGSSAKYFCSTRCRDEYSKEVRPAV